LITKEHIRQRAAEWGLRPEIVEKDYVLGWLLAGIANHTELRQTWVFKGGTCLKKCYFETYRFSEDLDFSLRADALYSPDDILRQLRDLARWVTGESGIELPESAIVVDSRRNKQGQPTFSARVTYRGPLAMPTGPRVLFDLTQHEPIAAEAVPRPIYHPYPDQFPDGTVVTAYCLEELFAEKTRALHERTRPRDLYDVLQLVENFAEAVDFPAARGLFRAKCAAKGIPAPSSLGLAAQVAASAELDADWKAMLAHQLPALPPLDGIKTRIPVVLAWIDEPAPAPIEAPPSFIPLTPRPPTSVSLRPVELRGGEEVVAPAGVRFWGGEGPLELIRFAGANRLMVEFQYHGRQRLAEPYSLRRAGTGNLLLYTWEEGAHDIRAFKVAEMSGLRVTNRTFDPRYSMELATISSAPARSQRRDSYSSAGTAYGPTYVFECPSCNKIFRRKRNDPTLRAHKRHDGHGECSGRRGYLVRTDFD
jgi:predicted nucleotidyltransferase component of viral defense system